MEFYSNIGKGCGHGLMKTKHETSVRNCEALNNILPL